MELANNILSQLMGQSFTIDSTKISAKAINFLHTLRKTVENEIRVVRKKKKTLENQNEVHDKLLKLLQRKNMFTFSAGRAAMPGLKTSRNLHRDSRNKKTFKLYLADSIKNAAKGFARKRTITLEDVADGDLSEGDDDE
jgi:hypothetical protein